MVVKISKNKQKGNEKRNKINKRTWPNVGRKWPVCSVIGGAHKKIVFFLTSNGADGRGSFTSQWGPNSNISSPFSTRLPPKLKSLFERRARKQSALRRTRFRSHTNLPQPHSSLLPSKSGTELYQKLFTVVLFALRVRSSSYLLQLSFSRRSFLFIT